jgi:hypothetical protein
MRSFDGLMSERRLHTTSLTGGRRKAAKLPFNQPGEGNRRPISKVGSYDLHADRQARWRSINRGRGRREATGGGGIRPNEWRRAPLFSA